MHERATEGVGGGRGGQERRQRRRRGGAEEERVAEVSEANGGMPRVRITSALGEGEVYLQGAHVTSWKPAGNDEALFVSTKSRWEEGQAIRGGIPICVPWFR